MNSEVLVGLIGALLLIGIVAVTMGKTKWKRTPMEEEAERARPKEERRVSGHDDD